MVLASVVASVVDGSTSARNYSTTAYVVGPWSCDWNPHSNFTQTLFAVSASLSPTHSPPPMSHHAYRANHGACPLRRPQWDCLLVHENKLPRLSGAFIFFH